MDETFAALRQFVDGCAAATARPGLRLLIYPAEWEAAMLARFPAFAAGCAEAGRPIELVDLGTAFLQAVERQADSTEALIEEERSLGTDVLLDDLGLVAKRAVTELLQRPLDPRAVGRLLTNPGALAAFTSFSAISSSLIDPIAAPVVLAFPGEGDDHGLSLLNLRTDTEYRTPRL